MSEPITSVEAAVRELGALPVPVGAKPKPVNVEDQREQAQAWEGHILGVWDGEFAMVGGLDNAVLKLARMVKADLVEIETLRSRVAELEAERHSTNEALDDAVQELRARVEPSPAPITLSTDCANCGHTLNWHGRSGCSAGSAPARCDCRTFAAKTGGGR